MPTVLLVDDESPIVEHFRYALERAGHTVLSTTSGHSAIRICRAYRGAIDVLVSDVVMNRISGFEVAAAVKMAHPNVSVIFMSGSPASSFPAVAAADGFLEKPFSSTKLLTIISRHIRILASQR